MLSRLTLIVARVDKYSLNIVNMVIATQIFCPIKTPGNFFYGIEKLTQDVNSTVINNLKKKALFLPFLYKTVKHNLSLMVVT